MRLSSKFWSFSVIFLLYFMFSALPSGMLTPLLTSLGYTNQEIGFLFSLGAISGIVVSAFVGRLADRFRKIKPFVILALIVSMILIGLIFSSDSISLICFLSGIAATALTRLISNLLDSWALETDLSIRTHYGSIRAFGSIGFALGLGVLVVFVDRYGYIAILPITWIIGCLLVIFISLLSDVSPLHRHEKPRLKTLFSPKYVLWIIVFFFVFFVIGVEDMTITMKMLELGANPSQIAWFYSAQALFELPLFFYGARLMRRIGAKNLLLIAICSLSAKMFLFAVSQQVMVMIALTVSQIFTFPLIMITSKNIIYAVSEPSQKISGQVIGVALYGNLSGILAPLLIGSLVRFSSASVGLYALGSMLIIPLGIAMLSTVHPKTS